MIRTQSIVSVLDADKPPNERSFEYQPPAEESEGDREQEAAVPGQ